MYLSLRTPEHAKLFLAQEPIRSDLRLTKICHQMKTFVNVL